MSQLLHPRVLDDFGLVGGLRWLCERFSQRTGIQVNYESDFTGRLPDELRTHLFRIAQEALTNAARHSAATSIDVRLLGTPRRFLAFGSRQWNRHPARSQRANRAGWACSACALAPAWPVASLRSNPKQARALALWWSFPLVKDYDDAEKTTDSAG